MVLSCVIEAPEPREQLLSKSSCERLLFFKSQTGLLMELGPSRVSKCLEIPVVILGSNL